MRSIILIVMLTACGYGSQQEVEYRKKPRPAGGAGQSGWDGIASIVESSCNNCHGKSIGSAFTGSNFKAQAQTRVANGSMPPGGKISAEDKAALLAYKP